MTDTAIIWTLHECGRLYKHKYANKNSKQNVYESHLKETLLSCSMYDPCPVKICVVSFENNCFIGVMLFPHKIQV